MENRITKTGPNGLKLIIESEGWSSKAYVDPGSGGRPFTIGYGSTLYEDGTRVELTDKPITKERGLELLKATLSTYERAVDALTRDDITQNQWDALVSFCYNVGSNNLKSSTLLKKVNLNPNDPTIAEQFLRWNKAAGKIMKGLTIRRQKEAELYFKK